MVKAYPRGGIRAPRPELPHLARTDAAAVEGLAAAIERASAYVDAGADMIFPEALADAGEFEQFRAAVDVPLLANMTEFGKSQLLTTAAAGRHRLQHRDLPGHHAAPGDGRRRGGPA